MKKGGDIKSPGKRKHGSLGGTTTPGKSSSIGLGMTPRQGTTTGGLLGSASKNWDFPDIGAVNINAADNWDEAAKHWDSGGNADAPANKRKSESIVRKEQQPSQQKPKAAPAQVNPDFKPRVEQQTPKAAPAVVHDDFKPRLEQHYPAHSTPPFSSTGTVVSTSTAGSGRSRGTVSSGSTRSSGGGSIFGGPGIYSGVPGAPSTPATARIPPLPTFARPPDTPPPPPPPPAATPRAAQPTPEAKPAAKATLYQFYGRKPRRKQLSNEDYYAWNNAGKPHELKFTAIFQCPVTGECFASGRYGDPKFFEVKRVRNNNGQEVEMVWFTKKAFAEHAAAAKCYDCLLYREALMQGDDAVARLQPLGSDLPYTRAHAPPLPLLPNLIADKIRGNQQRIQTLMAPIH